MARRLTEKRLEAYLQKGACCPRCGEAVSITGEGVEVENNEAVQEMHCSACDFLWTDVYRLYTIRAREEDLPKPKKGELR